MKTADDRTEHLLLSFFLCTTWFWGIRLCEGYCYLQICFCYYFCVLL